MADVPVGIVLSGAWIPALFVLWPMKLLSALVSPFLRVGRWLKAKTISIGLRPNTSLPITTWSTISTCLIPMRLTSASQTGLAR